MERRDSYQFPFSRYPAVRIAILMIAGILLFYFYKVSLLFSGLLFVVVLLLFGVAEWFSRARVSVFWTRLSTALFLMLIVSFGMIRTGFQESFTHSATSGLLGVSDWERVQLSGNISSISYTTTGKERWDVIVDSTILLGVSSTERYKARVLADEVNAEATLGDEVFLTGTIIPISEPRNPGEFDYKAYLKSQNITAQIKPEAVHRLTPNDEVLAWVWWREKALNLVDKNFSDETAPIAKALLIGYKQDLDSDSKQAFARAGLSHIMAVSGLHVGFIVAPFWVLIPYFWTRKYGKEIGLVLLLILLFCYAGITGFPSSVMRASVMAAFLSIGKLFNRLNNSLNFMAAAAIVLLIIDPAELFDIGFQLSFSAVLIILLILPTIQTALPYWIRTRWYGKPIMVIIISIVVQFGLYPLQVLYFGEISLVSPVANALFVPLLGIVVPLALVCLLISIITPTVGYVLNFPALLFLDWMEAFVSMAASWEWAWATASLSSNLIFLFWVFLIGSIAAWHIAALRWKMVIGSLCSLVLIFSVNLYQQLLPPTLKVTYFDVGQGDAALLKTPSGKNILIDAGVWSPGYNSGKSVVLPHLKATGVKALDAVILSHPHADHIGGILDIIEGIPVRKIYNSGYKYDSRLYQNYLQLANQRNIPVESIVAGDSLKIDPALLVLAYGPDSSAYSSDPNEHSVVIEVIYGNTEFLFTGDAGIHQEERLLSNYGNLLDTDILKVGHHGSRTSSGNAFLNQVTPSEAIISLAERNKFRHPHREAINRLGQTDAKLLFTSMERAIILESDGKQIKRIHW